MDVMYINSKDFKYVKLTYFEEEEKSIIELEYKPVQPTDPTQQEPENFYFYIVFFPLKILHCS